MVASQKKERRAALQIQAYRVKTEAAPIKARAMPLFARGELPAAKLDFGDLVCKGATWRSSELGGFMITQNPTGCPVIPTWCLVCSRDGMLSPTLLQPGWLDMSEPSSPSRPRSCRMSAEFERTTAIHEVNTKCGRAGRSFTTAISTYAFYDNLN